MNKYLLLLISSILFIQCSQKTTAVKAVSQKKIESPQDRFISELMNKMTLEEKIGQLNLLTPGGAVTGSVVSTDVEKKIKNGQVGGIFGTRGADKIRQMQEIAVNSSRLKIPLIIGSDVIHGHQTIFPIPLGLSCSWDMELIEKTARQAAREATADGIMWTFSPMVDIARDPRWGRIAEGAGEDPFLGSAISVAMVKGYQGSDISGAETMISCVKHFANYGAAEGGRDYATTDMSKVRMFNEYLPPYKAAVDAGVGSIMTSFNVIDYVPATGSSFLFTEVLRDSWGFEGFVVTDYTSTNEMINHGVGDLKTVSASALKAGVDMDMVGEGFVTTLGASLDKGQVTEGQINQACRRILTAKYDLGLFEDPYRYCDSERAKKEIMSEANRNFARQVAAESHVLLKNEGNVLPLSKTAKVALIGPLANSRRNMLGTWSVSGDHDKAVTVLEGMTELVGAENVMYAKGANISDNPVFAKKVNVFGPEIVIDERSPEALIEEAIEVAKKSEIIVAVVGEAADMSGEASSMANIDLQPSQKRLLLELKKLRKPIVLVLYNGRPMTLSWENEQMDAILDVWFGGTEGGRAVADVIYGDVVPSGKLTSSFPVSVGQIPVYHSMLNSGRPYNGEENSKFKSNYLDIPNEPLFPFGYGLSYSDFEYSNMEMSGTSIISSTELTVSITVKNTGSYAAKEIVQMYIRDLVGSISRPVKELKGFQKILLQPGESKKVSFQITEELLRFYNAELEHVSESGDFQVMLGTNSVDLQTKEFSLKK